MAGLPSRVNIRRAPAGGGAGILQWHGSGVQTDGRCCGLNQAALVSLAGRLNQAASVSLAPDSDALRGRLVWQKVTAAKLRERIQTLEVHLSSPGALGESG